MKMMKKLTFVLLAGICVVFTGCNAPKVSWEKAQDLFDGHRTETVNAMFYMGSDRNDHYLFHSFLTMRKTVYRVDKSELVITDEFPVTEDKAQWRQLEMPLRIDLGRATIITNWSEPQGGGYSPPAARSAQPTP